MNYRHLILLILVILSFSAFGKERISKELHASHVECQKAVKKHVKDYKTLADYKGEKMDITWFAEDAVSYEMRGYKVVLYCEGSYSIYKFSLKR